jgi:hypothetical protein
MYKVELRSSAPAFDARNEGNLTMPSELLSSAKGAASPVLAEYLAGRD